LFEKGITENEIVKMKASIDILSYISSTTKNNIAKTKNNKYENFANLFINNNNNNNNSNSNNNWRKEYEKLKWAINLIIILNSVVFDKIQHVKDRFRISYPPTFSTISNYKYSDSDDKKQEEVTDTIIDDNNTIIEDNDIITDYYYLYKFPS
jgi:hypothetical protein